MAGPIARTQPDPADRPEELGELQPRISRQFDDAPSSDLVEAQPQATAAAAPLPDDATPHPQAGVSSNINTGGPQ